MRPSTRKMIGSPGRLLQRHDCPRQSESTARPPRAASMESEEILRWKLARTDGYAPQEVLTPPSAASDMRPPAGTQGFFPRPPGLRGRMEGSHPYSNKAPELPPYRRSLPKEDSRGAGGYCAAACCVSFCAGSGLPRSATIFSTISFAMRP
jgi:hypothetical protein